MYVVLGASGHTGHSVAQNLLAQQKKVRVVGRNATHLQPLAAQGAEPFIGDVTDAATVTKALPNIARTPCLQSGCRGRARHFRDGSTKLR